MNKGKIIALDNAAPSPEKRKFLAAGLWTLAGLLGASFMWPVYELATRRLPGKKLVYFNSLPLRDMPEVGVKKIGLSLRGGTPDTRVFLKRDEGGTLTAFSAVCSHLGCIVDYNHTRREFICPCHGGRYDIGGNPVAGPPPAPLKRLPVRLAGEYIQVGFYI
ncbi:MAG: Rieske (2Fe-2S) protein [Nitrospirota bacterium]